MIQITRRDIELMRWVNGLGFVGVKEVKQLWGVKTKTVYGRLHQLVEAGYLLHEQLFHGLPGVYRVTAQGVQVSGDRLPPLKKIAISTYHHQLAVARLSLQLVQHYGGEFVPERQLRQQLGYQGVGQASHVCDGELVLSDKRIAIEVELTLKGKARREAIFSHYLRNTTYQAVWYWCGNSMIQRYLKVFEEKAGFMKIRLLSEGLGDDSIKLGSLV